MKTFFPFCPRPIVYISEFLSIFLKIFHLYAFHGIIGIVLQSLGPISKLVLKWHPNVTIINQLFEVNFKTIFFEKANVIFRIVILAIIWGFIKILNYKTPKLVVFAKINWTIHSVDSFLLKPCFRGVKQKESSLFIVNTFKETNTTLMLMIISIYKCGNSSNCLLPIVIQNPSDRFTVSPLFIFLRIEYFFNVLLQMRDPIRVVFINPNWKSM